MKWELMTSWRKLRSIKYTRSDVYKDLDRFFGQHYLPFINKTTKTHKFYFDEFMYPKKIYETYNDNRYPMPELQKTYSGSPKSIFDSGYFEPDSYYKINACQARSKIAILIPFRSSDPKNENDKREQNLSHFLFYMIPVLKLQNLEFKIFIIHQLNSDEFNRAKNLNIGFLEAQKEKPKRSYDCYLTHDIDRILVNFNISYHCHKQPFHYTTFGGPFGGVGSINEETMIHMNGFPNRYYGWGGEDQEIAFRMNHARDIASRYIDNKYEKEFEECKSNVLNEYSNNKSLIRELCHFKPKLRGLFF